MVGLSVILEAQKGFGEKTPKVINKVSMIKHSPSPRCSNPPPTSFLDQCFLCQQKLLPGKDIYMYKGDTAFCSEECRCRQILMDEEETLKRRNCSLAAMKPYKSSSSSSSSSFSRNRKGVRNRRAN